MAAAQRSNLISSANFAEWLDRQGEDVWWTADGDPYLTRRLALPAPSTRIAEVLRGANVNRQLRLLEQAPPSAGQGRTPSVDDYMQRDETGARVLRLSWDDSPDSEWLLIEDKEAALAEAG